MRQHTLSKYMTRLAAVLLALILLLSCAPAAFADGESGTMGDNLSWSLGGGTLTITGSGAMADIPELERAPWHEFREEIYQVVLPEGLTSIGDLAFYECEKLQSVVIPNSVTRIGRFAFAYCKKMELLNLGTGVTEIEECAFLDCYRLASLQLPESLKTIGKKAFYRCESIPVVTVPAGVTSLGISTFGYCKSLISADIQAQITELPTLLFYGCERMTSVKLPDSIRTVGYHTFLDCEMLNTVYYNGKSQSPAQIQQSIGQDVPGFAEVGTVTEGTPSGPVTSGTVKDGEDGTVIYESTTVDQGMAATVTTQIQYTEDADSQKGETVADITVTITGADGWDEAKGAVNEAIRDYNSSTVGSTTQPPSITIYLKDGESVDKEFVDSLAGKDVTITVVTQNGSGWRVSGKDIDPESKAKTYDLSYELTPGSAELCEKLGVSTCYVLRFRGSAQINAELMVGLGGHLALQNATLLKGKDLTQIQSAVVDQEGCAHFYLASVDKRSEYYIAINLPGAQSSAIIPDELANAYGNPIFHEPLQYEITGRTSSWGMTFGQVTWIMIAVLVGCVVTVGAVMFALNKRKLKRGYIPDLDGEEE